MSRAAGVALAALVACGPAAAAGHIHGAIGSRQMDNEGYWRGTDSQAAFGVFGNIGVGPLPLFIELGLLASAEEGTLPDGREVTNSIAQLSVGPKLMARSGVFRPYLTAGVASVGVAEEVEGPGPDFEDDDQSFGLYGAVGGVFRIGRGFELGADVRWLGGTDIELGGSKGDADSLTFTALIGWGWGR